MPRKSKHTATVKPASTPESAYGQGAKAIQAQQAIPLVDEATRLEGALGAAAQQPQGGGAVAPAQTDPFGAALSAAEQMPAHPSAIDEVTPFSEPMTSGLSTGPGPNQLNMGMRRDADLFTTMYSITGDPDMLLLAQRVRQAQQGPY